MEPRHSPHCTMRVMVNENVRVCVCVESVRVSSDSQINERRMCVSIDTIIICDRSCPVRSGIIYQIPILNTGPTDIPIHGRTQVDLPLLLPPLCEWVWEMTRNHSITLLAGHVRTAGTGQQQKPRQNK